VVRHASVLNNFLLYHHQAMLHARTAMIMVAFSSLQALESSVLLSTGQVSEFWMDMQLMLWTGCSV
jgi:hypothetical protein